MDRAVRAADRGGPRDEVLAPFGARFTEPFRPTNIRSVYADGTGFYDSISFNDLWTRVLPQT